MSHGDFLDLMSTKNEEVQEMLSLLPPSLLPLPSLPVSEQTPLSYHWRSKGSQEGDSNINVPFELLLLEHNLIGADRIHFLSLLPQLHKSKSMLSVPTKFIEIV